MFMQRKGPVSVLIVAAHPDDDAFGCGGTMGRFWADGHGIDVWFLGKGRGGPHDNQFDKEPLLHWVKNIEEVISEARPEVIFTHYEHDLNIDHRITYQAVITATRPMKDCPVKEIYSFEVPSSTEWAYPLRFSPDVFHRIDIEQKLWAIDQYKNEQREYPHPRSREAVINLAKHRGQMVGLEYAEAFKMVRAIR